MRKLIFAVGALLALTELAGSVQAATPTAPSAASTKSAAPARAAVQQRRDPASVPEAVKKLAAGIFVPESVEYSNGPGALIAIAGHTKVNKPTMIYVTPDAGQLLIAQVFDSVNRTNITQTSLNDYLLRHGAKPEDLAAAVPLPRPESENARTVNLAQISAANFIETGSPDAPLAYAFVDAQCVHCRRLWKDAGGEAEMRIRWIPISLGGQQSEARAVYALAQHTAQSLATMFSDEALPKNEVPGAETLKRGIKQLSENNALFEQLKFPGTPAFVIPKSETLAEAHFGYSGKSTAK